MGLGTLGQVPEEYLGEHQESFLKPTPYPSTHLRCQSPSSGRAPPPAEPLLPQTSFRTQSMDLEIWVFFWELGA